MRALLLLGLLLGGCGRCSREEGAPAPAADAAAAATPVKTARVERADLPLTVEGPGRTDATEKQIVRAPFSGTVLSLEVADGDTVRGGQLIATMVSRDSEAALRGAKEMLASAVNPQQRRDAERAIELAKQGMVRARLRAPESGIVLSHQADEGSQVNENDDLVRIVAEDSLVFIAQISQRDVARVLPGQPAAIALAAAPAPIRGVVHAVLPSGSATDLTAPVRIDFARGATPPALNLFGVVTITVGERRGVLVVPAAALLRDDITGQVQVATVTPRHTAHWVEVHTGVRVAGRVEVSGGGLAPGEQVIVSGHIGLPEGTRVEARP